MMVALAVFVILLCAVNLALLVLLLRRPASAAAEGADPVRTELRLGREESRAAAVELRGEILRQMQLLDEALRRTLTQHTQLQQSHQLSLAAQLRELADRAQAAGDQQRALLDARLRDLQEGNERRFIDIRLELGTGLKTGTEALTLAMEHLGDAQARAMAGMSAEVKDLAGANREALERIRGAFDARVRELQEGNERRLADIRVELGTGLKAGTETLSAAMERSGAAQDRAMAGMGTEVKDLARANQEALERIRGAIDARVRELQESNERKLEEMRQTVDEKLHEALEKRLGESFKLVSERLESVHKGLGEMQTLASGVGDLKRVLTNVKTRGTWAEVQLGAILEQILTADQFQRNVCVKQGSAERVEFAVRLPGPKDDPASSLWLPIDSKFPHEDYARLQAATEAGDPDGVRTATTALLQAMRVAARDIHDKYIDPPATTDFAIMFLATEGLYAEALRQSGFLEELQQRHRIVLAGPTTLSAILNSLRMGFQTLAVEKRAAEVWRVLGGVKSEFGRFGIWLEKVQRQLQTASHTLAETGTRTRAMERRLRGVEQLGPAEGATVLQLPGMPDLDPGDDESGPPLPAEGAEEGV